MGAVPQRSGIHPNMGGYLFVRLQGPSSPFGAKRRRGMRKFFVLHERKTWRPELQPAFNLKFVIPVCTFNRIVCGRGSAKARYPPINGWIFVWRALRDRHPPTESFDDEGGCASFAPHGQNLAGYVKVRFRITVFISVLFVKPICLRPRFRKGAEIQFSVVFFWRDLRKRHPPSEQSDFSIIVCGRGFGKAEIFVEKKVPLLFCGTFCG